jgi:hypothetical protein
MLCGRGRAVLFLLLLTLPLSMVVTVVHADTYSLVNAWGSLGGPIQPNGIANDSLGNLYVADTANFAVEKFASNGTLLMSWGSNVLSLVNSKTLEE